MPILTLKFKDRKVNEYRIRRGEKLTIGRRASNDVVIENLAVSGVHAKIDSMDDGFILTDLQSKNGTFVNENLITSHWLKDNEIITIGKHTLVFSYEEDEQPPMTKDAPGMDQTMVMDTSKYRKMMAKSTPSPAAPQMQQGGVSPGGSGTGMLSYLAGGAGEVELAKKLTKIGKSSSSDVVVKGMMVGQTAASISKRPNGYYIGYVGGMAKTKVNGETVKESVLLKEFDVIEIGSAKLQFIYKS
jgi:pSer/pThr/pTyr-binding forkhead associated (FHA) protein